MYTRNRNAFSLLELMLVVGVISILLGFLLPALTAVARHSRNVTARHETRMLAAAWTEYYNTYQHWPTGALAEADGGPIDAQLATILQGLPPAAAAGVDWNPHRLRFVDFSRFDPEGNPVNPWVHHGRIGYAPAYYVRFDIDYDNSIQAPAPLEDAIPRSVIVWTHTPYANPTDDNYIIGSWQE